MPDTDKDLADLMQRLQAGDKKAVGDLVLLYSDELKPIIRRRLSQYRSVL